MKENIHGWTSGAGLEVSWFTLSLALILSSVPGVMAGNVTFFNPSQVAVLVATGTTSDTISSEGYRFTCSRDKLFTGGVGLTNPIGRSIRVPWPDGVEAQGITAGPKTGGARITLSRNDGTPFDLTSFSIKLLANTVGAGGSIEVMPILNGEDALTDPIYFQASGNYSMVFSYSTAPSYLGNTTALTNYEAYKIGLYVDFAVTAMTLRDFVPPTNHPPTGISLSPSAVSENEPTGTVVGVFSTIDPDAGDTFTYSLVSGNGSEGNGFFQIDGDALLTTTSFNFEAVSSYNVRVESRDQDLLATQQIVTIDVLDMAEPAPTMTVSPDPAGNTMLIRWTRQPNHRYTVRQSTNLLDGFTVVATLPPTSGAENVYTAAVSSSSAQFWDVITEP